MLVVLALVVLMFIKNNVLFTSSMFTYLFSLSLPAIALTILGALIIHQHYIYKVKDSHSNIYTILTFSLIGIALMLAFFFFLIGLYLDNPKSLQIIAFVALVPYYISILTLALFFVYISPGLLNSGPTG